MKLSDLPLLVTNGLINTAEVFDNGLSFDNLEGVSKRDFIVKKRISINSLYPHQQHLEANCLEYKLAGHGHTMPYVCVFNGKNILLDGHHTVAAKKYKGNKYIMALTYHL